MSASGKLSSGNLPAELTSFVGRRTELADVRQALETGRLVTLIGAGGVGKTRLALGAASGARRAFRDGAWLVEVSPLRDEELLAPTVAATLGLQSRAARWAPALLGQQLANRALLLVLDNCEHMSDSCAVLVEALLTRCPDVRVLATSRQPLDVPGEYLLAVHPLQAPGYGDRCVAPRELGRFDAVTLFVERARTLEPRFELTRENAAAVAEICYRLDGLPLAVELAAARVRHLSPQQMLDRLEPGLSGCHHWMSFLELDRLARRVRRRAGPRRHRADCASRLVSHRSARWSAGRCDPAASRAAGHDRRKAFT